MIDLLLMDIVGLIVTKDGLNLVALASHPGLDVREECVHADSVSSPTPGHPTTTRGKSNLLRSTLRPLDTESHAPSIAYVEEDEEVSMPKKKKSPPFPRPKGPGEPKPPKTPPFPTPSGPWDKLGPDPLKWLRIGKKRK